jgi:hypothetical protein
MNTTGKPSLPRGTAFSTATLLLSATFDFVWLRVERPRASRSSKPQTLRSAAAASIASRTAARKCPCSNCSACTKSKHVFWRRHAAFRPDRTDPAKAGTARDANCLAAGGRLAPVLLRQARSLNRTSNESQGILPHRHRFKRSERRPAYAFEDRGTHAASSACSRPRRALEPLKNFYRLKRPLPI